MSTLFFADLIPGIFRYSFEVFKNSLDVLLSCHSFFFSDTFFPALAHFFQSLFLFSGCTSPLLDESQDFSIFERQIFAHFCCCRCHHARFIVVVLDLARVAAGMEHDRTCLFILMWKLCTKMFFRFVFRMFFTLRALFRQSLLCLHVAAAAAATFYHKCRVFTSNVFNKPRAQNIRWTRPQSR